MCGIGGILKITKPSEKHEPIPEAWLDAIDEEIKWRGPDGAGRFRDHVTKADGSIVEVALVHRRLSIIDLEGGHQPFIVDRCPRCAALAAERWIKEHASSQGMPEPLIAVVFNGCIYNHRELRRELESLGHVFTSDHSDTEVIAHGWAEWNEQIVEVRGAKYSITGLADRLDGMYAFGLWSRTNARLWLGRDEHGEKPLYVSTHEPFEHEQVAFASTVSGARRVDHHVDPREPTDARLAKLISFGWQPTGFRGLGTASLPLLEITEHDRSLTECRGTKPPPYDPSTDELTDALGMLGCLCVLAILVGLIWGAVSLVTNAIRHAAIMPAIMLICGSILLVLLILTVKGLRRRGAIRRTLSTGPDLIEAALNAAVGKRLESDVPIGCFLSGGIDSSLVALYAHRHLGSLDTFCVQMPDGVLDESKHAEAIARVIGTRHHTIQCDPRNAAQDFVQLIRTLGLPFSDSSILPTYWLCRATREHVKVALSGDGGDELFYGYERYRAAAFFETKRKRLLTTWLAARERGFDLSDPRSRDSKLARLLNAARGNGYSELVAVFQSIDLEELTGLPRTTVQQRTGHKLSDVRMWDLVNYLPGDLMRKVDTASMAVGLEVRCPFLARAVAEVASSQPAEAHMYGEPKHLLKQVARRHFPREFIDRPKQGFAIPISDWWRSDFGGLGTLLFDYLDKPRPFGAVHDLLPINLDYVRQMIDEHWAAGGLTPKYTTRHVRKRDHGQRLFALVSLAIWAELIEERGWVTAKPN